MMTAIMLKSLLMIAMLLPAASNDLTYWWRTTDGAVVGTHHSQQCSLVMFNVTQAVVITWDHSAGHSIRLEDNSWHFTDTPLPLVLRIGGTQLAGTATGSDTFIAMPLAAPIETILAHTDAIDASYIDDSGVHRFGFTVDRTKMPALLKAVERCRRQAP